jgi:hypothetical protein
VDRPVSCGHGDHHSAGFANYNCGVVNFAVSRRQYGCITDRIIDVGLRMVANEQEQREINVGDVCKA